MQRNSRKVAPLPPSEVKKIADLVAQPSSGHTLIQQPLNSFDAKTVTTQFLDLFPNNSFNIFVTSTKGTRRTFDLDAKTSAVVTSLPAPVPASIIQAVEEKKLDTPVDYLALAGAALSSILPVEQMKNEKLINKQLARHLENQTITELSQAVEIVKKSIFPKVSRFSKFSCCDSGLVTYTFEPTKAALKI